MCVLICSCGMVSWVQSCVCLHIVIWLYNVYNSIPDWSSSQYDFSVPSEKMKWRMVGRQCSKANALIIHSLSAVALWILGPPSFISRECQSCPRTYSYRIKEESVARTLTFYLALHVIRGDLLTNSCYSINSCKVSQVVMAFESCTKHKWHTLSMCHVQTHTHTHTNICSSSIRGESLLLRLTHTSKVHVQCTKKRYGWEEMQHRSRLQG